MQAGRNVHSTGVPDPVSPDPHLHLAVQTKLSWRGSDKIDELRYRPVLYVEEARLRVLRNLSV